MNESHANLELKQNFKCGNAAFRSLSLMKQIDQCCTYITRITTYSCIRKPIRKRQKSSDVRVPDGKYLK